jgi:hypothetical protein
LQDRRRAILTEFGYKLLSFCDDKKFSLFNVLRDPAEEHELSSEEPGTLERMKATYREISADISQVDVIGTEPLKGAPAGRRW